MSNYIDCQLKVEGVAAPLKEIKRSMIITHEFGYSVNLVGICDGKKGIVTSNYYKTNKADDTFVIIENHLQDFHLNLYFKETLFEFIGEGRLAETTTWVDEFLNRLTIKENYMVVNFTAAWEPPIIEVILASLNYPDLNFRLSYKNISDHNEFGSIEGSNGYFTATDLNTEELYDHSEPNKSKFHHS